MGLDQFARSRKAGTDKEDESVIDLAYWRKHNRLQGWMEQLWISKGGVGEFNCEEVPITLEDLDELEIAINNMDLPETEGFFFGDDSYEDYEEYLKESDLKFIDNARKEINNGNEVYYSS